MKKFILPAIVAVAAVSGIFGYFNQPAKQTLNTLALVNLEALTNDDEVTKCPDYNYVPDHFIIAETITDNATCTKKGSIQVGTHIFHGDYEKGQEYTVVIEEKNCFGEQKGACCDQREVGVRIVD